MKAKLPSFELLQRVTVVIRTVGERTEEVCRALVLEQGVQPEAVFVVRERPFSKTLRVGSEIGLQQGRKWTLFVDADLLLRPSSIERMLRQAELQPARVCQVQGYCLDKFFGGARVGGIHLYRTSLLNHFIDSIPEEGIDIRPETSALKTMASKGFPWLVVPELIGLHGFEQSYKDIFRTCFVHAHKHIHLADSLVPFWHSRADLDLDYRVALAGFCAGLEHSGSVQIDEGAPYFEEAARTRIKHGEKQFVPLSEWHNERVEAIVLGWQEPSFYRDQFPSGMTRSNSILISRAINMFTSQVARRGIRRGVLAGIGFALMKVGRKLI